ncbi:16S rRNA (guanine(966)-N(2))-methyltransferase RsmD [Motiliproteus sediminis]|uniref:16S rRNA (guanine(966)-N(2))-methyltransferase RsmD n=1 Tax=Motiliproteus sediminis TaxID=1468178 RepID=UPI001AEFBB34|nr:16S rRNA (guanine(966)-N(2))-methyltransferase RsmD [Motiliproteus sediminis]
MPRKPARRPAASNQLRIIGGEWRGRKLSFPTIDGLRPTPDRIRETLFNWLQLDLPGARCLDLFSGSGALGLEALSRGAGETVLVDRSGEVVRQLEVNLALLKAKRVRVEQDAAQRWLERHQQSGTQFDLVFLDPPFRQGMLEPCCALLEQGGLLSDNAMIYIEAEKELRQLPVPANWIQHRQKSAGQVSCYLYRRGGEVDG